MKNRISNISAIIFVISAVVVTVCFHRRNQNLNEEAKTYGRYFLAIIKAKIANRGGSRRITYLYKSRTSDYKFEQYVSRSFYKEKNVGDTIIVKGVESELPWSIICESLEYQ